jgi:hypothetical protein
MDFVFFLGSFGIFLILGLRNKIQKDESLKVDQYSKGEKMLH